MIEAVKEEVKDSLYWDRRPNKNVVRQTIFFDYKGVAQCYLGLVGNKLECFKLLRAMRIVDHNTKFIFVENDTKKFSEMVEELDTQFESTKTSCQGMYYRINGGKLHTRIYTDATGKRWKFYLYFGELHNLPLTYIRDTFDIPPISIANIDLCCNLLAKVSSWCQNELNVNLDPKSLVSYTVSYNTRGNDGIKEMIATMKEKYGDRYAANLLEVSSFSTDPELEVAYRTLFQSFYPTADIIRPIGYIDGAYQMMTWKITLGTKEPNVVIPVSEVEEIPPPICQDVPALPSSEDTTILDGMDAVFFEEDDFMAEWLLDYVPKIKVKLDRDRNSRVNKAITRSDLTWIIPVFLGMAGGSRLNTEIQKAVEALGTCSKDYETTSTNGDVIHILREIAAAGNLLRREGVLEKVNAKTGSGLHKLTSKGHAKSKAVATYIREL